jgi:hypothetical protein
MKRRKTNQKSVTVNAMAAKYQTRHRAGDVKTDLFVDSQGNLSVSAGNDVIVGGLGMDSFQYIGGSATGTRSIAFGADAVASNEDTISIGSGAEATALRATTLGQDLTNSVADTLLFGTNGTLFTRLEAPQTVQQVGSNLSAVTLNASMGKVFLATTMSGGANARFVINNNRVTSTSVIQASVQGHTTTNRALFLSFQVAAGALTIYIRNNDPGNETVEPPTVHFVVYGGT